MTEPKTVDIDCAGYAVKTDIYEGQDGGAVLLSQSRTDVKRMKTTHIPFQRVNG
jgi:hypothetical protein